MPITRDTDLETATRALIIAAQDVLDRGDHDTRQALRIAMSRAEDELPYMAKMDKAAFMERLDHALGLADGLVTDADGNVTGR